MFVNPWVRKADKLSWLNFTIYCPAAQNPPVSLFGSFEADPGKFFLALISYFTLTFKILSSQTYKNLCHFDAA